MQQSWVIAVVGSRLHAEQIVERLKAEGVSGDDVSVLVPGSREGAGAPQPSITTVRAIAQCGALSWIGPLDVISLPQALSMVSGGPLGDLIDMAGSGGLSGVLEHLKIGQPAARRLEDQLTAGHPLLSVRTASPTRFVLTCELFGRMGATDLTVGSSGERLSANGRSAGFALPRFA